MNRAALRLALAMAILQAAILPAAADTVAEVTRKWGLIGSWATDCAVPPSKARPYLSYDIAANGRVMHRRDFGTGTDESIASAETVIIKRGGHHHGWHGARAQVHHDRGWHRGWRHNHHSDRVVVIKKRYHRY